MMFVILLFMFQFTGVMKEQLSEYESNEYADDTTTSFQRSDAFLAEQTSADACEVIYVGEAGGAEESVVKTWCSYRKRTFFCSSSLALLDSLQDDALQVLVVDGSKVTSEEEVAVLRREAQMGVTVIFATLPQSSVIREYRDLRELLGIRAVIADEIPLAGMHLFSGFLLGGEEIYEVTKPGEEERQDMNPSVPWYTTGAGTKTYMVGTLSDETIEQTVDNEIRAQYVGMDEEAAKNSLLPAILWRNSVDTAKIFCVNGDCRHKRCWNTGRHDGGDIRLRYLPGDQRTESCDCRSAGVRLRERGGDAEALQPVRTGSVSGNCVAVADLHCLPDGGKDDLHDDAAVYVYG